MNHVIFRTGEAAANQSGAMERKPFQKRASSKSQTNRVTFLRKLCFTLLVCSIFSITNVFAQKGYRGGGGGADFSIASLLGLSAGTIVLVFLASAIPVALGVFIAWKAAILREVMRKIVLKKELKNKDLRGKTEQQKSIIRYFKGVDFRFIFLLYLGAQVLIFVLIYSVNVNNLKEIEQEVVGSVKGVGIGIYLICGLIGIATFAYIIYCIVNNSVNNSEFDKILDGKAQDFCSQVVNRALDAHGMDAAEVTEIPPILAEDFYAGSQYSKLCKDGTYRASEYQMTYLMFSNKQMYAYSYVFDLTGADTEEQTKEFFYEDITSVDISKTQRDMPVPRPKKHINFSLFCILLLPAIFMIPICVMMGVDAFFAEYAMSVSIVSLIKLTPSVVVAAILLWFLSFSRRMEIKRMYKRIISVGVICAIISMFSMVFFNYNMNKNVARVNNGIEVVNNKIERNIQDIKRNIASVDSKMKNTTDSINNLGYWGRGSDAYKKYNQQIVEYRRQIVLYNQQIGEYEHKTDPYHDEIKAYEQQLSEYKNRGERLITVCTTFITIGWGIIFMVGLILLIFEGFHRRVVEKLNLRLTVAGDSFECAMNPENIAAIQGMKAKIREKKKA